MPRAILLASAAEGRWVDPALGTVEDGGGLAALCPLPHLGEGGEVGRGEERAPGDQFGPGASYSWSLYTPYHFYTAFLMDMAH